MKRLVTFFASLSVAFFIFSGLALAQTDPFKNACSVPGASTSSACQAKNASPLTGPTGTLTKATRIISFLAGIAAMLLIIIGGFMYVLSGGDSSKISNAKDTIVYAFVGIIIVIVAQGIIVFVLNKL